MGRPPRRHRTVEKGGCAGRVCRDDTGGAKRARCTGLLNVPTIPWLQLEGNFLRTTPHAPGYLLNGQLGFGRRPGVDFDMAFLG
jgi:hypothetical protein